MTRMPCESDRCTHCCHTEGACTDRYGQSSHHSLVNTSRYTQCPRQSLCRQKYVNLPVLCQSTRWHRCWVCTLILIRLNQISPGKWNSIAIKFTFIQITLLLLSRKTQIIWGPIPVMTKRGRERQRRRDIVYMKMQI